VRTSLLACLACVGLAVFAAVAEEPAAPKAPSPQLVARTTLVMKDLESQNYSRILDQMHHATTDTAAENAADRRSIAAALQLLSTRFGKLEGYELAQARDACVCVSLSMASDEYWAKDAETDHGAVVAFTTRHAKMHAGIVRITETNRGRDWIRSIEIGVPPTVPGANDQMTRIARELIERMHTVTRKPKDPNAPPKPD